MGFNSGFKGLISWRQNRAISLIYSCTKYTHFSQCSCNRTAAKFYSSVSRDLRLWLHVVWWVETHSSPLQIEARDSSATLISTKLCDVMFRKTAFLSSKHQYIAESKLKWAMNMTSSRIFWSDFADLWEGCVNKRIWTGKM